METGEGGGIQEEVKLLSQSGKSVTSKNRIRVREIEVNKTCQITQFSFIEISENKEIKSSLKLF